MSLYFVLGHLNTLDMTVSFFITATLFLFLMATQIKNNRRLMTLMAIFVALAVLTKGLIGVAFPLLIIGLWTILLAKWKDLPKWHIPLAIILFLVVALPWHIAMQLKYPFFFQFYVIKQQFLRYTIAHVASRHEPHYFYMLVWSLGAFPWTIFLLQSVIFNWPRWRNRHHHEIEIFLLIWIFAVLLFFSLSQSELIPYIVPIFAPTAVLIARYMTYFENNPSRGLRIGFGSLPYLGLVIGCILIALPRLYPMADPHMAIRYLLTTAVLIMLTTILASLFSKNISIKSGFYILVIGTFITLISLFPGFSSIDHRSIKPLALKIQQLKKPGDIIVSYDHYYQDLPFYVRQPVIVTHWFFNELHMGYKHQPSAKNIMKTNKDFWQIWKASKKRIFVVTRDETKSDTFSQMKNEYKGFKPYIIAKTQRNVLFSNRP